MFNPAPGLYAPRTVHHSFASMRSPYTLCFFGILLARSSFSLTASNMLYISSSSDGHFTGHAAPTTSKMWYNNKSSRETGSNNSDRTIPAPQAPNTHEHEVWKKNRVAPKIGVSFSPAGLLTPFHIGASAQLQEYKIIHECTALAGSSGGALAAVTSALKINPKDSLWSSVYIARRCRDEGTRFLLMFF